MEEPSHRRLHPEQVEIVAGRRIAGDTFHCVTPAQSPSCKSIIAGQAAEAGVSLLVVFKRRIRRGQYFPACPRLETKLVEVLGLAHIQRAQQHRIYYSEDEDVCPNPKHQSD